MERDPVVYDVVLADGNVERIVGADGYVQEGPLTTFFRSGRSRSAIDSWSERIASFRTAEIRRVVRRAAPAVDPTPALRAVPERVAGDDNFVFGALR